MSAANTLSRHPSPCRTPVPCQTPLRRRPKQNKNQPWQLGFYEAGTTRPIAAFTPERLELFADSPTFKELGQDFVYFMQRSVVGAPGMSAEAEAYYRNVFQQVFDSEEWQTYRKKKSLYGDFLTGQELKDYWAREKEIHRAMLKDIGEI